MVLPEPVESVFNLLLAIASQKGLPPKAVRLQFHREQMEWHLGSNYKPETILVWDSSGMWLTWDLGTGHRTVIAGQIDQVREKCAVFFEDFS
jgi:hypothetical protein